jgi:hypothetical protein
MINVQDKITQLLMKCYAGHDLSIKSVPCKNCKLHSPVPQNTKVTLNMWLIWGIQDGKRFSMEL